MLLKKSKPTGLIFYLDYKKEANKVYLTKYISCIGSYILVSCSCHFKKRRTSLSFFNLFTCIYLISFVMT